MPSGHEFQNTGRNHELWLLHPTKNQNSLVLMVCIHYWRTLDSYKYPHQRCGRWLSRNSDYWQQWLFQRLQSHMVWQFYPWFLSLKAPQLLSSINQTGWMYSWSGSDQLTLDLSTSINWYDYTFAGSIDVQDRKASVEYGETYYSNNILQQCSVQDLLLVQYVNEVSANVFSPVLCPVVAANE